MALLRAGSRRVNWRRLSLFGSAAVVIGIMTVVLSFAATAPAAFEVESGALAGGATAATVAGASGGQAVVFKASATAIPSPGTSVKPDLTNTGARSATRTDLPVLTVVTGAPSYTSGTPANPTIIRDKQFNAPVTITGHDIQFINCDFRGVTTDQIIQAEGTTPANESIQFIDSTIGAASPAGTHPVGFITGVKFIRVLIHNGDHAIHDIEGTGYVSINSSILDARDTSDNASSLNGPHGNGIYTEDGPAPHVAITNTVIYGGNSQVIFAHIAQGNGVSIDGWVFDGDWFYGNNRNSNWSAENAFFSSTTSAAGGFKNIHVRNSRFQRLGTGLNSLTRETVTGGLMFAEWSNNVWDDNGQAILAPVLTPDP